MVVFFKQEGFSRGVLCHGTGVLCVVVADRAALGSACGCLDNLRDAVEQHDVVTHRCTRLTSTTGAGGSIVNGDGVFSQVGCLMQESYEAPTDTSAGETSASKRFAE